MPAATQTAPLPRRSLFAAAARPIAIAAATVLATTLLALAIFWPAIKSHLAAAALLDQVAGQPVPPILARLATYPISTQETTIPTPDGPLRARLYLPAGLPNAPGMVVLHGVHHLGIDEPRLAAFARALASTGVRVLTPELPGIKDYRIGPESTRAIADSTSWFAQQTGSPVGVLGLSFAGGLALVAAEDPAYAPSFRFVVAVGSQASLRRVADYYRTGRDPNPDGSTEILPPHDYGALVFEYKHLEDFVPAADIPAIRDVLRAHLYEDPEGERSALAALNPAQQTLAHRLMNTSDPVTQAALTASYNLHLDEMAILSPATHIHDLRVPVFLLHGEADNVIPAAETLWLQHDLPPGILRGALISPVLSHVDVAKSPTATDEWRVVHLLAQVLQSLHRP